MPNPDLEKYIATSREQKIPDETIKAQLVKSGWNENQVTEALLPVSEAPNLPAPPVPRFGMWVAFQYIILFITLYMSATSIAGVLGTAVDHLFPDNASVNLASYFNDFMLKGFLAALIVSFPIFAVLFVMASKQAAQQPAVRNLGVRKLLIYLTLLGTFLIMIGNLFFEIFAFLNGAATTNSFGHLGVTLLVSGSIFVYLILAVREDRHVT